MEKELPFVVISEYDQNLKNTRPTSKPTMFVCQDLDPQNPRTDWDQAGKWGHCGDYCENDFALRGQSLVKIKDIPDYSGHYYFITREKIFSEWGKGGKNLTPKMKKQAAACLVAEQKCWKHYCDGSVYGYRLFPAVSQFVRTYKKDGCILVMWLETDENGIEVGQTDLKIFNPSQGSFFSPENYNRFFDAITADELASLLVAQNLLPAWPANTYFLNRNERPENIHLSDLDEINSCWGFFGCDHEESGLFEAAKEDLP